MAAYVYILASQKNGTIYIGATVNLYLRLQQHRDKAVSSFTRQYNATRLVFAEEHASIYDARYREAQLKRWHRAWKINLIEATNPTWEDLAKFL